MAIELVILDFDGTFTDAYAEAKPYVEGFKLDLFDLLGRDASDAWQQAEEEIQANPTAYGWLHGPCTGMWTKSSGPVERRRP